MEIHTILSLSLRLVLGSLLLAVRALDSYLGLAREGAGPARGALLRPRAVLGGGGAARGPAPETRQARAHRAQPRGRQYFGATTFRDGRALPSIIAMSEAQHTAAATQGPSAAPSARGPCSATYESHIERSAGELVEVLGSQQGFQSASRRVAGGRAAQRGRRGYPGRRRGRLRPPETYGAWAARSTRYTRTGASRGPTHPSSGRRRRVEAGEERRRRIERAFVFIAFFQLRQARVHIAWLEI
ncbi:hypothetical protein DL767_005142 [Monosporascus sp. MG133]|nr:hypothetical protein DL767_005142 [Monosporascus sp. MG133]